MAKPMTPAQWRAALKAEGVKYEERSARVGSGLTQSWTTHNRNHKGKFDNVNGVVIHHTAGRDSLGLVWNGTAALPGPLAHAHLDKKGLITLTSSGRANHAGGFAQNAHDAVVAEAKIHPKPDAAEPVDGNRHYYGIEIENLGNGKDPYPSAQYDQAVRWAAAICRTHGWTAQSVIGHKEGTRRKIDPSFSMGAFRADVDERLAHAASWNGKASPTPPPAPAPKTVEQRLAELEKRVTRLEA